jgi:hypothetical protein
MSLLNLPSELNSNERFFDVHSALRKLSVERLREVCQSLPINQIDLASPGSSSEMKHAVQSIICVATYVISNSVPQDIADLVILPLVTRIENYGSTVHPELGADELFNLALEMSKKGRVKDALRCINVLQTTVVKYQRPILFLMYMTLHNAALDSNAQQDIRQALAYYESTPELHTDSNVKQAVVFLRKKLN